MSSDPNEFLSDQTLKKWRELVGNGRELLEQEFKNLRQYDPSRAKIGTDTKNRSKNRYALVYPYDEEFCRVRLNEEFHKQYRTNNDYINASKVRRFLPNENETFQSQTFVAAQGPTENTIDDFLRMIVEQKIEMIVMLSSTYEPITQTFAREHAPYFTEKAGSTLITEFFSIRTESVYTNYCFTIRRLKISSEDKSIDHHVYHYHYSNFVDKKIPTDQYTILDLAMRIVDKSNFQKRILVHCSAGIGRTGVFIALCYLLNDFQSGRNLNVKKLIDIIRFYRAHLVQTTEQYEYIYRCLVEVSIHPPGSEDLSSFLCQTNNLELCSSDKNDLITNFNNRNNRAEPEDWITTKRASQNSFLNREQGNIPYDYNNVILHSPSTMSYINASFVMNIISTNGFILTQEPLAHSLQPFFSMLLQEHKSFIVAAEEMKGKSYADLSFSDNHEISTRPVPIDHTRNKTGIYFASHLIEICRKNLKTHPVFIFEYKGKWLSHPNCVPESLEHFVRFVDRSIYHQKKMNPNRLGVLVHDLIGGTKAAFYCIAQNLIDRLLIDNRVAIETFIATVCQQRMNAILSMEQYIALHQIVRIWNDLKNRGALESTSC